jgi:hypothetical protein
LVSSSSKPGREKRDRDDERADDRMAAKRYISH